MHQITIYPVANGDTCQITLENGRRMLLDYRHLKKAEDGNGPEIDLASRLRADLEAAQRDYFDVVAFTHGDEDHIENSTEFFELEHADKYKGDGRIKIKELWVPAALILEPVEGSKEWPEFAILRQEARYRLKQGKGIRVFSKPDMLKNWLDKEGIKLDDRRNLITDAGQIVPGFSLANDKMEIFCHSPFVKHTDGGDIERNAASLIFQIRLDGGSGKHFNYMAIGDSKYDVLEDIVSTTKFHKNMDRLNWDLLNVPHHCSYLALSDVKGSDITTPKPLIEEFLLRGQEDAYIVSSSYPIPDESSSYQQTQPPHIQAKKCYEKYLRQVKGRRMLVTMEEPNTARPKPLVFEISHMGSKLVTPPRSGAAVAGSIVPPRAG